MVTGLIIATCLLITGDPTPGPDFIPVNSLRFEIPLVVTTADRSDIQEFHVYVSQDLGKHWEMLPAIPMPADDRVTPKAIYQAGEDGMYYFTVSTISKTTHKENPPQHSKKTIAQKILVDTTRPVINLKAKRVGEKIQAKWSIVEERPNKASFRLEFQDPASEQWFVVPEANSGPQGMVLFPSPYLAAFKVRLTMKDVANNLGMAEACVLAFAPEQSGNDVDAVPPPSSKLRANAILPPVKFVDKPEVKMGIDIVRSGGTAPGKVDVYLTTDDGLHWSRSGTMTVTNEAKPDTHTQFASVLVTIPRQEVVYGIFLAADNEDGWSAPRDGKDRPMMRVEVDTRQPDVLLFHPKVDRKHEGVMLLTWKATDRNLDDYPISIQYAIQPNGPWQSVTNTPTVPNTGSYAWLVPNTPQEMVYLKLTVCDKAGNVSEAKTEKPVLLNRIRTLKFRGNIFLPPVKYANKPEVTMDIDVANSDEAGVGKVDVYLTTDDGLHWSLAHSVTPTITKPQTGSETLHATVLVKLPEKDVVHGIFLVLKNKNGDGDAAPGDGRDRPMMRVKVATVLPEIPLVPTSP